MIDRKVELIMNGKIYDITPHVNPFSVNISKSINSTLATGSFLLQHMKKTIIGMEDIDFSRSLIRYSKVVITIQNVKYEFLLSEDEATQIRRKTEGIVALYDHNVQLIEPSKILQRRTIPDITVTQPKGDAGIVTFTTFNTPIYFEIKNNLVDINLEEKDSSNNSNVLEGRILKKANQLYEITVDFIFKNIRYNDLYNGDAETEIEFDLLINNQVIRHDVEYMQEGTKSKPYEKRINYTVNYTTTNINEEVKLRGKTNGKYWVITMDVPVYYEDFVMFSSSLLRIVAVEEYDLPVITIADVVKKLLLVTKINPLNNNYEFTLGKNTENRLLIDSPEFTFSGYTLWDALLEISNCLGAIPYINNFNILEFAFFDEMESKDAMEIPSAFSYTNVGYLEDYVNAVELNADNVLGEEIEYFPFRYGWVGLRADTDGTVKITTDNLGTHLPKGIGMMKKMMVKGIPMGTYSKAKEWDITKYVLEKTNYDVLPNNSEYEYNDRITPNKNNRIYYTRGDNKIMGMSFTGTHEPLITGSKNSKRAIKEIIASIVTELTGGNVQYEDLGIAGDEDIEVSIEYLPYTGTRASIYKNDQTGFQADSIKYFNQSARVSDAKALGNVGQSTVNRLGNTNITYSGKIKDINSLPNIGTPNSLGQVLVNYSVNIRNEFIHYVASYVRDYAQISDFVGIKSELRQYEIPKDNLVVRRDKYTEFIVFSKSPVASQESIYKDKKRFVTHLRGTINIIPTFAIVETRSKDTIKVDTTIDIMPLGNTLTMNIKMKDNYSAGIRKRLVNGVYFQEDVKYTDSYGGVENVVLRIYDTGSVHKSDYPMNISTPSSLFSELSYNIKKDAREILSISQEVVYMSNESEVRIYGGITKITSSTKIVLFEKFPSPSALICNYVNTNSIKTLYEDRISIYIGTNGVYEGYGIVNDKNELLIAVKMPITSTINTNLYYGFKRVL